MRATVKKGTIERADALAELGLTDDSLNEVVMAGEYARNSCTKNDPPCAPGFVAWKDSVRTFRDILIPEGWTRNDDNGFSTVVNPDETIAIAAATGDDKTGKADANPKTKYPRGAAAE